MDNNAYSRKRSTRAQDTEACQLEPFHPLVRSGNGTDWGYKSKRAAQIAGQHIIIDQQEQRCRQGCEEQRCRRVEFCQYRDQECCPKHCNNMLGTNTCGTPPCQPLIRFDHFTWGNMLAVAVKLPCEIQSHASPFACHAQQHSHAGLVIGT